MDSLLEAYAGSSGDSEENSSDEGDRNNLRSLTASLGELPADVTGMFEDSEYDLGMERRRADERAGEVQWVRRFPHGRGNWPTYVFIPVPTSMEFVRMAEASVSDFRGKLIMAWEEQQRLELRGGRKRGRDGRSPSRRVMQELDARSRRREGGPGPGSPAVVMNPMTSDEQHLSLSKTVVLRAHQVQPFVNAVKDAVKSSRRFTVSIVGGYDVLVNEDKSRSFVCLRVRGGRHLVMQLIGKVDPVMERFKQPIYYKDPVVHVSVASVAGDISQFVRSSDVSQMKTGSTTELQGSRQERSAKDDSGSNEDAEEVPSEVCFDVGMVACKAGTTLFQAPFATDR